MKTTHKVDKEAVKKAFQEYIDRSLAFKKEVTEGADFYETAEKYGKKFVAPILVPERK